MGRPKKEAPNHGGLYEVKVTIGKGIDGKTIRKSFYSPVSKRDAKQKADEYLARKRAAEITGAGFASENKLFEPMRSNGWKHLKKAR